MEPNEAMKAMARRIVAETLDEKTIGLTSIVKPSCAAITTTETGSVAPSQPSWRRRKLARSFLMTAQSVPLDTVI